MKARIHLNFTEDFKPRCGEVYFNQNDLVVLNVTQALVFSNQKRELCPQCFTPLVLLDGSDL